MNCNEFEQRLADAWGNELSGSERVAFEAHAHDCASCRQLYEGGQSAVELMRSLDGPRQVTARREENRLVIEWPGGVTNEPLSSNHPAFAQAEAFGSHGASRRRTSLPWFLRSAFRHAAVLLIAFTAGYMFHAGLMLSEARREAATSLPSDPVVSADAEPKTPRGVTLHAALANAYARSPGSSELAMGLMALSRAQE